jgi:hypothetical protein
MPWASQTGYGLRTESRRTVGSIEPPGDATGVQPQTEIDVQQDNESLNARFHYLVDKRLDATASQEQLTELQWIERALSAKDERQMAEIQAHLEAQHGAAIQKLSELIAALKELPENPRQQAEMR